MHLRVPIIVISLTALMSCCANAQNLQDPQSILTPRSNLAPRSDLALDPPIAATSNHGTKALQAKQDQIASELRVAVLQQEVRDQTTKVATTETTEIDWLKQIEVTLAQQKTAKATLEDLKSEQIRLAEELGRIASQFIDSDPPHSILLLDQLNDSLASNEAKRESLEGSLLSARETVERAKVQLEESKRRRRQFRDADGAETDPNGKSLDFEVQLAGETLALRRQELAIEEEDEVTNLTRRDDRLRISINVGVAYGSPLKESFAY